MGISAVMTCYNRNTALVNKAISSILKNSAEVDFRLILLDNHSPNEEVRLLLRKFGNETKVKVLDFERNLGKGRGFNYVWKNNNIPYDNYVAVVSDDIEVLTTRWDSRLKDVLQCDERMGSVSAFIESGPGMLDKNKLQVDLVGGEIVLISEGSVGGDLTMYRPGILEKAGLFAPTLYGHEDVDMAVKLKRMGYHSGYVKDVKMNHFGHDDPEWTEWKRDMHDGMTGLQFPEWLQMRNGNLWQKARDVAMTRFRIPMEGQRGLRS